LYSGYLVVKIQELIHRSRPCLLVRLTWQGQSEQVNKERERERAKTIEQDLLPVDDGGGICSILYL
jgi:hypothetical protein